MKQLTIKYSSERAADQSQIKQLKQLVENYKEELTRLYDLVGQKKKDYENLQHQVIILFPIIVDNCYLNRLV